ncbi:Transposon Tf2-7 polyprotein [Ceratobasidium theobromae]|uniref:Transposon Tf2-7 polyprotein n=1 Tax=Ceratobasidium theobromae TaxID=1582974 RepID=A0A5N5QUP0_9AGAM|nr:Transposon Tf2-7 polyprotein [Ceratobasidium theobromae]
MKKPEAFDGKRGLSARTFMTQMETYFLTRTVAMGEIEKVYAVLTNMGNNSNAAAWTQPLLEQRNKGIEHPYLQSWEAFRTAFLLNFDDPAFQLKASDELMAITQTSSVAEYASRFRALSAQVNWNDETLMAGFKRGLKSHIRMELTKATLFDNGRRSFEEWVTVAITLDNVLYTRPDRTAVPADRVSTSSDPRPRGVLVPEDQKELRKKEGRCIKCSKPGHQVQECRGRWTLEPNKANPVKGREGKITDVVIEESESGKGQGDLAAGLSPNIHIKFHKITEPIETLVDSGSSCNFIDISFAQKNNLSLIALPNEREVQGINGKILQNKIRFKVQEKFEVEGRTFDQKFYVMPLGGTNAILGMEWLKSAKPIIKWNPFEVCWEDKEILQGKAVQLPDEILDFADVFSEEAFKELPPHRMHDCEIRLREGEELPKPAKIYPMSPAESKACQEYINNELKDNKIQRSTSPIAAPAFFVKKSDGSLRLVIDYRKLNDITISDQFPIPRQDDLLEKLKNAKVFSKLDLRWGFNNVRIKEGDEWKTAFRTKEGLFEYKVMPFGLKNAPATFQRFMNELFADLLDDYVVVYIDDILIYSKDHEEHTKHVREVLKRLREAHLFCKESKCKFWVNSVVYIGIVISPDGISMDKEKIEAIEQWKTPTSLKELQAFLGFCNFYRRFINRFSEIAKPLTSMTKKGKEWSWSQDTESAFMEMKRAICSAPVLRHPHEGEPYFLETDASGVAMGAILSQRQEDGYLHPVAFLSRGFNEAQMNYDTHDKELCAIITAFEQWRYLLEGTEEPITVYTDHQNLEYWAKASKFNRRHARWYQTLASYNFHIVFRPGKMSSKPDILSRQSNHADSEPAEQIMIPTERFKGFNSEVLAEITDLVAEEQASDENLSNICEAVRNRDKLPPSVAKGYRDYDWKYNLLHYKGRIVVPQNQHIHNLILRESHDHPLAGHQGQARTLEMISRKYWWPNMTREVNRYVESCEQCQRSKGARQSVPGRPLEVPNGPWEWITYDLIVKLPKSMGYDSILVVIDRFSKMGHFLPCNESMSAEMLAEIFLKEVWKLHGTPKITTSDRGTTFTSKFLRALYKRLDIEPRFSSAYHPETDGQSERANQWLEGYLRSFGNARQDDWAQWLPLAEFSYNNHINRSTKKAPFEIIYGRTLEWKDNGYQGNIIHANEWGEQIRQVQDKARACLEMSWTTPEDSTASSVGDRVMLLRTNIKTDRQSQKLDNKRLGPFLITKKISSHAFELDLPASLGIHPVFHVSLLTKWREAAKFDRPRPKPRIFVSEKGEEEQEVQEILDWWEDEEGQLRYRVRWVGEGEEGDSWERAEKMADLRGIMRKFLRKFPTAPTPANWTGRPTKGKEHSRLATVPEQPRSPPTQSHSTHTYHTTHHAKGLFPLPINNTKTDLHPPAREAGTPIGLERRDQSGVLAPELGSPELGRGQPRELGQGRAISARGIHWEVEEGPDKGGYRMGMGDGTHVLERRQKGGTISESGKLETGGGPGNGRGHGPNQELAQHASEIRGALEGSGR